MPPCSSVLINNLEKAYSVRSSIMTLERHARHLDILCALVPEEFPDDTPENFDYAVLCADISSSKFYPSFLYSTDTDL